MRRKQSYVLPRNTGANIGRGHCRSIRYARQVHKIICAFALAFALNGCDAIPKQYTSRVVLPLAAGQEWDMQDQDGNITHFAILARPDYQGCQSGTFLDMYITKSATSAYWAAGVPGAWDNFILKSDSESWRSVTEFAGYQTVPPIITTQKNPILGSPLPYFVLPPNLRISRGETVEIDTAYTPVIVWFQDLSSCALSSDANQPPGSWGWPIGSPIHWHTTTTVENVSTPVYTGDAVKTVYCETPAGGTCTSETWYFAPLIGLVEISFPPQAGIPNGYTTKRLLPKPGNESGS
jgi:hypothetical protein